MDVWAYMGAIICICVGYLRVFYTHAVRWCDEHRCFSLTGWIPYAVSSHPGCHTLMFLGHRAEKV